MRQYNWATVAEWGAVGVLNNTRGSPQVIMPPRVKEYFTAPLVNTSLFSPQVILTLLRLRGQIWREMHDGWVETANDFETFDPIWERRARPSRLNPAAQMPPLRFPWDRPPLLLPRLPDPGA